jgi:hypothetical protein
MKFTVFHGHNSSPPPGILGGGGLSTVHGDKLYFNFRALPARGCGKCGKQNFVRTEKGKTKLIFLTVISNLQLGLSKPAQSHLCLLGAFIFCIFLVLNSAHSCHCVASAKPAIYTVMEITAIQTIYLATLPLKKGF